MEPFTTHTGRAVPLRRSNVDTDQIIPSDYLKRVTRTGFADGLFAAWRAMPSVGSSGRPSVPRFVLDDPAYKDATILIAGPDFGTGSSREHAVWALQDHGFRAVISPRFADIFRGNALKNGLLPVVLTGDQVESLMAAVESDPTLDVTVDLANREVRAGPLQAAFDLDEHTRWRLMEGLDDIALTLRNEPAISSFESSRPEFLPRIS
jgi:3-isopropylmalate/(R)-2-methylmalate dehydratase small subunit